MGRKVLNEGDSHFDFDLFVIGTGSGGVRAARLSANFGAKVGICELSFHSISSDVIGEVNVLDKKIAYRCRVAFYIHGAVGSTQLSCFHMPSDSVCSEKTVKDARNYRWEVNDKVELNWKKLLWKKTDEIITLNGIYKYLLSNAVVKLSEGEGKIVGPNEVELTQPDGTKLNKTRTDCNWQQGPLS
ncbi:hypothetical protein SLEP1_g43550 [Rubroshorea leprosula]|uniref:Uncharacterized protein n=1 Tax=Rubroshorea leprosula TaxID=152421 RepID=A0AAV5LDU6_9ROSI|nr:hypothetical protein SLEP1_g43550 [Rubroshorea leprosula]